jgi:predicted Rossmann fold nucleotide-binding protein DprA/Smf involved in DNA uptake
LLLCGHFGDTDTQTGRPLTPTEYDGLSRWLWARQLTLPQLLEKEGIACLAGLDVKNLTAERIAALLQRGGVLALAVERWLQKGFWIISRADQDYPRRWKQRLGRGCPPLLYGAGSRTLLKGGGIAVVGSRQAADSSLQAAHQLGERCAQEGLRVISGGAKGIDTAAMSGALAAAGEVVGVLSDGLEKAALTRHYREAIAANRLLLVSPSRPEAGFSAGNAMGRNKLVYTLADAAVVVESGAQGGTWQGARENLKQQWVPLFVRRVADVNAGNSQLLEAGAQVISDAELAAGDLARRLLGREPAATAARVPDFYRLCVASLEPWLDMQTVKLAAIVSRYGEVLPAQLRQWLKRAEQDGRICRAGRPARYQIQREQSLPL